MRLPSWCHRREPLRHRHRTSESRRALHARLRILVFHLIARLFVSHTIGSKSSVFSSQLECHAGTVGQRREDISFPCSTLAELELSPVEELMTRIDDTGRGCGYDRILFSHLLSFFYPTNPVPPALTLSNSAIVMSKSELAAAQHHHLLKDSSSCSKRGCGRRCHAARHNLPQTGHPYC